MLAILVIVSHSYQLARGVDAQDPVAALSRGQLSGGSLAVSFFFLLSGYLIVRSWLQSLSASVYLRKRIVRIYPAFLVAMFLSMAVAALCTRPGPLTYLRILAGRNDLLLRTCLLDGDPSACLDLGSAFAANPYPGAVNHSLWTLRPELICYLLVAGAGVLINLGRRGLILAACLVCHAAWAVNLFRHGRADESLWRFLALFLTGAVFYLYRDRVPFGSRPWLALCSTLIAVGLVFRPWLALCLPTAGGYLLFSLTFARLRPFGRVFLNLDLSYGMYVYAWPVQQACVFALGVRHPLVLAAVCLPVIGLLAWASWVLVERPCLRWKGPPPQAPGQPSTPAEPPDGGPAPWIAAVPRQRRPSPPKS